MLQLSPLLFINVQDPEQRSEINNIKRIPVVHDLPFLAGVNKEL